MQLLYDLQIMYSDPCHSECFDLPSLYYRIHVLLQHTRTCKTRGKTVEFDKQKWKTHALITG